MTARVKSDRQAWALLAVALAVTLIFLPPLVSVRAATAATELPEATKFVQTNVSNGTDGNWTVVDKPVFPIYFNDSQIGVGCNWTVTEPLVANHTYHVYFYGAWVNDGATPNTDYNIFVYNPVGELESIHTSAAGLAEHLGNTVNDAFFTPNMTGNYTYKIVNNAGRSVAAQAATFMAIEEVNTDAWFTAPMEGRNLNGSSGLNTAWAYEFYTQNPKVEIYIKVPSSLTMYEAKLYVMSSPKSLILNEVPLAVESGLYGGLSGSVGGYSLDSATYRGVAYDSCEYPGEDIILSYTANPSKEAATNGKILYHLVLTGEAGNGDVEILVKTHFGDTSLAPTSATKLLGRVYPTNQTKISYVSNGAPITAATLEYSTDSWGSRVELPMQVTNWTTVGATIPGQKAGTTVDYMVSANDTLLNTLSVSGSFAVKQYAQLNITVPKITYLGDNITVSGILTGCNGSLPITVEFTSPSQIAEYKAITDLNGTFTVSIPTNATGTFSVEAAFVEDTQVYPASSNMVLVSVEEPPFMAKNGVLIGAAGFFGVVAAALAYYVKKRRQ
jgi:hypothetical protein